MNETIEWESFGRSLGDEPVCKFELGYYSTDGKWLLLLERDFLLEKKEDCNNDAYHLFRFGSGNWHGCGGGTFENSKAQAERLVELFS